MEQEMQSNDEFEKNPKLAEEEEEGELEVIIPPICPKIPQKVPLPGEIEIIDDYFWLRDRKNPKVMGHLEQENAYAKSVMKETRELQDELYYEFEGRELAQDFSAIRRMGNYFYYERTEKHSPYLFHCRKYESIDNTEEVILDENEWAEGEDFFQLAACEVSSDHNFLAFSTDTEGSERFTIHVKDLQTGVYLDENIENTAWSFRWGNDNKARTLFYTVYNEKMRSCRLYRHIIGVNKTDGSDDTLLYQEQDERFVITINLTCSKKYLLLNIMGQSTSEVHYLNADTSFGEFQVIVPRKEEVKYYVTHHGKYFYIITNDEGAYNYKLMKAPIHDQFLQEKEFWEEILPHREDVLIDHVESFRHHLVVWEWHQGLQKIRVHDLSDGEVHYVDLDFLGEVYHVFPGIRGSPHDVDDPEVQYFNTSHMRFTASSFLLPPTVFEYDMDNCQRIKLKSLEVLGFFPDLYTQTRIWAPTEDGKKVPISLVYKNSARNPQEGNPMILKGYGSYGGMVKPHFSAELLSLLDRGFIYGIAHVRGDATLGSEWYQGGKKLLKMNTFNDFISSIKHLIKIGFTSPQKLAIYGRSAGGLIAGYVANHEDHLCSAILAEVPFVDVIGSMLDPSVPWVSYEWEEWGNPNEEIYRNYMKKYSPYDNIKAKDYPSMLLTCGYNDTRVGYWEPAKFVSRIREYKKNNSDILLLTHLGGHEGASSRWDKYEQIAFEYAFLIEKLGVRPHVTIEKPVLSVVPDTVTPPALLRMFHGYQLTMILNTAIDKGIFDFLNSQPSKKATAKEVSTMLKLNERSTRILMLCLVAMGLLSKESTNFSLTSIATVHLVKGNQNYVGALRHAFCNDFYWNSIRQLPDILEKGADEERPLHEIKEEEAHHLTYITALASESLKKIILPWASKRKPLHVLDVACGSGLLGYSLIKDIHNSLLWALDYPNVIPYTRDTARQLGVEDRVTFIEGDVFTSDLKGPYDIVILGSILSKLAHAQVKSCLQAVSDVLKTTGRLVIIDHLAGLDQDLQLEAVLLLVSRKQGEVRSLDYYQKLLASGGYSTASVHNVPLLSLKMLIASKNIIGGKKPETLQYRLPTTSPLAHAKQTS